MISMIVTFSIVATRLALHKNPWWTVPIVIFVSYLLLLHYLFQKDRPHFT